MIVEDGYVVENIQVLKKNPDSMSGPATYKLTYFDFPEIITALQSPFNH